MPSKKRNSRKRSAHRQGLSGNPQRRDLQLRLRHGGSGGEPVSAEQAAEFREMAYRLAGGARPEPWWQETHGRILDRARALTWPSRRVDVETQVCELVGDEYFDRLNSKDGSVPEQWLRALAEEAGAALRADLADGAGDWEQLWALLRGLALTTPPTPAELLSDAVLDVRAEFPDIKDPYEVAMAEAYRTAVQLLGRGLAGDMGDPVARCEPTGEPLLARDVYGSRLLLAVPFGYEEGQTDHWYAWDVDACWLVNVVGAGVFGSAEDALHEWRDSVGPAAAGAALTPCPAGWPTWLLGSCLTVGPLAEMLTGFEPREFIREYYRMRRRARVLVGPVDAGAGAPVFDTGHVHGAFLDWYEARHEGASQEVPEAVGVIVSEWDSNSPDERSFYACSPHRVEMTARLIRNSHDADCAEAAVELLPEWTQWCIEQSGLDGDAAVRSLEAAQSEAASVHKASEGHVEEDDEESFRRTE